MQYAFLRAPLFATLIAAFVWVWELFTHGFFAAVFVSVAWWFFACFGVWLIQELRKDKDVRLRTRFAALVGLVVTFGVALFAMHAHAYAVLFFVTWALGLIAFFGILIWQFRQKNAGVAHTHAH